MLLRLLKKSSYACREGLIDLMLDQHKREYQLQEMRVRQHERLTTESAEQREARLHDLSAHQCQRLATCTGSTEDREARLHDLTARQRE